MEEFSADEFIQGFLEESGEHLQSIHQNLFRLDELLTARTGAGDEASDDASEDAGAEQAQLINELFRSFHTIKGLAGMVGLAEGANLSHSLEAVLQAVRTGQARVDAPLLDHLLEGTRLLERVVATLHHSGQEMPPTQAMIDQLQRVLQERSTAQGKGDAATDMDMDRGGQRPGGETPPLPESPDAGTTDAGMPDAGTASDVGAGSPRPVAGGETATDTEMGRGPQRPGGETPPLPGTGGAVGAGGKGAVLAVLPDLAAYPEMLKSLSEAEVKKVNRFALAGRVFTLGFFVPSAEKSERGENVDYVRSRLGQVGAIIKAVPLMQNGPVRFAFLVASAQPVDPASAGLDEMVPLAVRPPAPHEAAGGPSAGRGSPPRDSAARESAAHPPAARASAARAGREPAPAQPAARSTVVRVELERLDELVRYTGDLVLLRGRLEENLSRLDGTQPALKRELNQTYQQLGRTLRDLRRAILRARMVPLAEVFNHMPLVVRDVARTTGKEVRLKVEGENAEVDKQLVERLLDPLVHLLRNAVIHGIESPAERAEAGKPTQGHLTLRGTPEGDHILITVADDGRGLDLESVGRRAEGLGWLEKGRAITAVDALDFITRPGFTTRDEADLAAGRGMGLDIVLKMVRSFGGSLELESTPGEGSAFLLRLPLTLMIMDALIVRIGTGPGAELYAVPRDMVDEVIEIDPAEVVQVESGEIIQSHDAPVVLHHLARLLDLPAWAQNGGGKSHQAAEPAAGRLAKDARPGKNGSQAAGLAAGRRYGLVRRAGGQQEALVVDQVTRMMEVVVHTITEPLIALPGIGGATELGDGRVVLILDLPVLLRTAKEGRR